MSQHLSQATHNQNFHNVIDTNFKNQFHDWKITILFYVAIHYLKALADLKKINIGNTHFDIEQTVNPDRPHAKMRITKNAWREYKALFKYSQTARYEGITDLATFELLKHLDHLYCLQHLENFKKYVQGQGVKVE
jgi:hypothetical protein